MVSPETESIMPRFLSSKTQNAENASPVRAPGSDPRNRLAAEAQGNFTPASCGHHPAPGRPRTQHV